MKTAYVALRDSPHYRKDIFESGLRRLGYVIDSAVRPPKEQDVLVIWNRYGVYHERAREFEKVGAKVLVTENAYLGREDLGGDEHWLALSLNHHCGAGTWFQGDNSRWDDLNVKLEPWRYGGNETVVLRQRGIGEPGVAMPKTWTAPGRIRQHPGKKEAGIPLDKDLANASAVITWASGAGIRAVMMGIPVFYALDKWIGGPAGRHISLYGKEPALKSDEARTNMLRRLIWAQWRRSEIASGEAFETIFRCS